MPAPAAPPARSSHRRSSTVWLGLGLWLALCAWWWHPNDGHLGARPSGPTSLAFEPTSDQPPTLTPTPTPPPTPPQFARLEDPGNASPPAEIAPDEWRALQAALADHPDRQAELRRIVALLQAQAQVRRFQALSQSGAEPSAMRELALAIDARLPGQLARSEISAGEARVLKARLLEVLEPDPARQAQALSAWLTQQIADAPAQAADPRDAAYLATQAQLSAAWQAQAEGQRDPAVLARQLDSLRKRTYARAADSSSTKVSQP